MRLPNLAEFPLQLGLLFALFSSGTILPQAVAKFTPKVTVTFWKRSKETESQNVGNFVGNVGNSGENRGKNQLTERQRIICDAIKIDGNVTAKTLAVTLSVSARTMERELNFLRKEGYITKEGKPKAFVRC